MSTNEYIYTYTRAQAIEDGMLISVDEKISREAGLTVPVALTCSVYEQYIYWTEQKSVRQRSQDQSGRLWDILWMCSLFLRSAAKKNILNTGSGLLFTRERKQAVRNAKKKPFKSNLWCW